MAKKALKTVWPMLSFFVNLARLIVTLIHDA